ncbi:hypothetical protein FLONG3_1374 [Fusarium longipes]|uniref:Uncharacterized protein n=1 Tax=Fusarium longipes TaxID=694270 RepID=A0A395T756_9HYPO|nr:hypothetical protein FLONG3_1374 [Fusarium longipes]
MNSAIALLAGRDTMLMDVDTSLDGHIWYGPDEHAYVTPEVNSSTWTGEIELRSESEEKEEESTGKGKGPALPDPLPPPRAPEPEPEVNLVTKELQRLFYPEKAGESSKFREELIRKTALAGFPRKDVEEDTIYVAAGASPVPATRQSKRPRDEEDASQEPAPVKKKKRGRPRKNAVANPSGVQAHPVNNQPRRQNGIQSHNLPPGSHMNGFLQPPPINPQMSGLQSQYQPSWTSGSRYVPQIQHQPVRSRVNGVQSQPLPISPQINGLQSQTQPSNLWMSSSSRTSPVVDQSQLQPATPWMCHPSPTLPVFIDQSQNQPYVPQLHGPPIQTIPVVDQSQLQPATPWDPLSQTLTIDESQNQPLVPQPYGPPNQTIPAPMDQSQNQPYVPQMYGTLSQTQIGSAFPPALFNEVDFQKFCQDTAEKWENSKDRFELSRLSNDLSISKGVCNLSDSSTPMGMTRPVNQQAHYLMWQADKKFQERDDQQYQLSMNMPPGQNYPAFPGTPTPQSAIPQSILWAHDQVQNRLGGSNYLPTSQGGPFNHVYEFVEAYIGQQLIWEAWKEKVQQIPHAAILEHALSKRKTVTELLQEYRPPLYTELTTQENEQRGLGFLSNLGIPDIVEEFKKFTNEKVSGFLRLNIEWFFIQEIIDQQQVLASVCGWLHPGEAIDNMMKYLVRPVSEHGYKQSGILAGTASSDLVKDLRLKKAQQRAGPESRNETALASISRQGTLLSSQPNLPESFVTGLQHRRGARLTHSNRLRRMLEKYRDFLAESNKEEKAAIEDDSDDTDGEAAMGFDDVVLPEPENDEEYCPKKRSSRKPPKRKTASTRKSGGQPGRPRKASLKNTQVATPEKGEGHNTGRGAADSIQLKTPSPGYNQKTPIKKHTRENSVGSGPSSSGRIKLIVRPSQRSTPTEPNNPQAAATIPKGDSPTPTRTSASRVKHAISAKFATYASISTQARFAQTAVCNTRRIDETTTTTIPVNMIGPDKLALEFSKIKRTSKQYADRAEFAWKAEKAEYAGTAFEADDALEVLAKEQDDQKH